MFFKIPKADSIEFQVHSIGSDAINPFWRKSILTQSLRNSNMSGKYSTRLRIVKRLLQNQIRNKETLKRWWMLPTLNSIVRKWAKFPQEKTIKN